MIYVSMFLYLFNNFMVGFLIPLFFTPKKEKTPNVVYGLIYFGMFLIPSFLKFYSTRESVIYFIIYYLAILGTFLFIFLAFLEPIWKKLVFVILLLTSMMLSECVSSCLFEILGLETSIDFATKECVWLMLATIICLLFFLLCLLVVWKKFFSKEVIQKKKQWGAIFIPAGLMMHIGLLAKLDGDGKTEMNLWGILILGLGVILEVVALSIMYLNYEKQQKIALIEEINRAMKTNSERYEALENEIDAISKKRHDRNNQMVIIGDLLEKKDNEGLRRFIDEIV